MKGFQILTCDFLTVKAVAHMRPGELEPVVAAVIFGDSTLASRQNPKTALHRTLLRERERELARTSGGSHHWRHVLARDYYAFRQGRSTSNLGAQLLDGLNNTGYREPESSIAGLPNISAGSCRSCPRRSA